MVDCGFEITRYDRGGERTDVGFDDIGVETHRIRCGEHRIADRVAERIQQLLQRVACARLCRLRPEETEQLVTAPSPFACRGQHGEQRQPAAVMAMGAEDGLIRRPGECKRAEGRQTVIRSRVRRHRRVTHMPNLTAGASCCKKTEV